MHSSYTIAVAGATGLVGEAVLSLLSQRDFPAAHVHALASAESAGKRVSFAEGYLAVQALDTFEFDQVDISIFCTPADISLRYAPLALDAGVVIDCSAAFRFDAAVPLVAAKVNPQDVSEYRDSGIIACPGSASSQILSILVPVHEAIGVERINAVVLQPVSAVGSKGVNELSLQTAQLLNGKPAAASVFPQQIAFNAQPFVDCHLTDNDLDAEAAITREINKITGDLGVQLSSTVVQVPIFYGQSTVLQLETRDYLGANAVQELLSGCDGIELFDSSVDAPTAVTQGVNSLNVCVGNIKEDPTASTGLHFWIVSDNVRSCAALNAVNIAETLIKNFE